MNNYITQLAIMLIFCTSYLIAQNRSVEELKDSLKNKSNSVNSIESVSAITDEIKFRNENNASIITITDEGGNAGSITIPQSTPTSTANKLYNEGGTLKFSGSPLSGGGGVTEINHLSDAKYQNSSLYLGEFAGTNSTSSQNVGLGANALNINTTGVFNSAIGFNALSKNNGDNNAALGRNSLRLNTSGNDNTAVGKNTLLNNLSGSGNVALGAEAAMNETGSNKLYIENSSSSSPLIWGDFANDIITINGNLGVGTQSPSDKLHVAAGDLQNALRVSIDNITKLRVLSNGGTSIGTNNTAGTPTNGLYVSGNVGFGVSNPAEKLEVNGTIKSSRIHLTTGANAGYVLTSNASGIGIWASPSNDNDWTISGNNMYSTPSGNLGIGTTNPGAKLDVTGKIKSSQFQLTTGASDGYVMTSDASGNATWQVSPGGLDNDWIINGSEIYHYGNVGIGNSSPNSQLSVGGNGNSSATISGENNLSGGFGIYGVTKVSGFGVGVQGSVSGAGANETSVGVFGKHINGGIGVKGESTGSTGIAIHGTLASTTGLAGKFEGPVEITGGVTIGVPSGFASGLKLEIDGGAGKPGGGSWTNTSDIRLKNIFGQYEKGLSEIERLRTIKFKYKQDNPLKLPSKNMEYGFIAQEVQNIFPEAVNEGKGGYLNFNMHSINVAMVNAIQELSKNNKKMATRIENLEKENENLKTVISENNNLRSEIDVIKAELNNIMKQLPKVKISKN